MNKVPCCIIFDLFKVLVVTEWEQVIAQILGDSRDLTPSFMTFFKSECWADYQRGALDNNDLEARLPNVLPAFLLRKLMEEMPFHARPIPEMINLLLLLKQGGHRLYLLTNVVPSTFFAFQQRFDFMNLFDGKLPSFEANALKPDRIIYQKMLYKFNLEAKYCLFIDDHEGNIVAARGLGIDGIVYTGFSDLTLELGKKGVI